MDNKKTEQAYDIIGFRTADYGESYYVTCNQEDEHDNEYCIDCIRNVVNSYRHAYKKSRKEAKEKLKEKNITIKERQELIAFLKEKKRFGFEGHDPDFGGGSHEPYTCYDCGATFHTGFEAEVELCEEMLEELIDSIKSNDFDENLLWKLHETLYNYDYLDKDAKKIIKKIAKIIIKNQDLIPSEELLFKKHNDKIINSFGKYAMQYYNMMLGNDYIIAGKIEFIYDTITSYTNNNYGMFKKTFFSCDSNSYPNNLGDEGCMYTRIWGQWIKIPCIKKSKLNNRS